MLVFARMAVGDISPMLLVSVRWIGTFILLVLFAGRAIIADLPAIRRNFGYTYLLGTAGLGGFGTLIYYSAYTTTAVNIGIIQGAMPAIVLIGSYFFFRTSCQPPANRRCCRYHPGGRLCEHPRKV